MVDYTSRRNGHVVKKPTKNNMKNATTTATVNNNTKTVMHTIDDVHALFVKSIGTVPVKLNYSDAIQKYTGFTDFSVNMRKSLYRVYMSDANVKVCTTIDNTLTVHDAPHSTKSGARDFYIDFTDYNVLKKCIETVVHNLVVAYNATKPTAKVATKTKTTKTATAKVASATENV